MSKSVTTTWSTGEIPVGEGEHLRRRNGAVISSLAGCGSWRFRRHHDCRHRLMCRRQVRQSARHGAIAAAPSRYQGTGTPRRLDAFGATSPTSPSAWAFRSEDFPERPPLMAVARAKTRLPKRREPASRNAKLSCQCTALVPRRELEPQRRAALVPETKMAGSHSTRQSMRAQNPLESRTTGFCGFLRIGPGGLVSASAVSPFVRGLVVLLAGAHILSGRSHPHCRLRARLGKSVRPQLGCPRSSSDYP